MKRSCISELNACFFPLLMLNKDTTVFFAFFIEHCGLNTTLDSRLLYEIVCVQYKTLCVMPTGTGSDCWRQLAAPSGCSQSFPPCALPLKAWRFLFAFLLQQRSPWRIFVWGVSTAMAVMHSFLVINRGRLRALKNSQKQQVARSEHRVNMNQNCYVTLFSMHWKGEINLEPLLLQKISSKDSPQAQGDLGKYCVFFSPRLTFLSFFPPKELGRWKWND